VNTLELGIGQAILCRNETAAQVAHRLYPGSVLITLFAAQRSLNPHADFCNGYTVNGNPCIQLIEMSQ